MSAEITLRYPFELNGKQYSTLSLRRLTAGDMMNTIKQSESREEVAMRILATAAGIPVEAATAMDLADFVSVQAELAQMLGFDVSNLLPG